MKPVDLMLVKMIKRLSEPISEAQPILSNHIIEEYEVRQENKSIGIVSLIILAIMFSILIPFNTKQEPVVLPNEPFVHITFTLYVPNEDLYIQYKENKAKAKSLIDQNLALRETIDNVELPTCDMVLTSLGKYYITGYTSSELGGSTMTASGATCHRASYANRLTEPTTCAIDPSIHDFGDLFYIPYFDTVYIADDTGSAVKGKHLDLYFWDSEYSYAMSITGKYEVYSVEYVYGTVPVSNYDVRGLITDESLGSFFS